MYVFTNLIFPIFAVRISFCFVSFYFPWIIWRKVKTVVDYFPWFNPQKVKVRETYWKLSIYFFLTIYLLYFSLFSIKAKRKRSRFDKNIKCHSCKKNMRSALDFCWKSKQWEGSQIDDRVITNTIAFNQNYKKISLVQTLFVY